MKKRRLFIFVTGQYRTFWHSWKNLVDNVLNPTVASFDIYVSVGIDQTWKSPGHLWQHDDRQIFQSHLRNEWDHLQFPPEQLIIEWIGYQNQYFQQAIASLQHYRDKQKLDPYWFDYLVHRSGSCMEYAQISQLYDIVCSQYEINDQDLMMRTRTDILLRHPISFECLPPTISCSTKEIFKLLFPTSGHFEAMQEATGREVSMFPAQPTDDRWIITLRKNLIYILPLKFGRLLCQVVQHYGDWDSPEFNHYWFNAESQFRGCFRSHNFTLWEYSQDKDESYGDFENLHQDLPIYAIYR